MFRVLYGVIVVTWLTEHNDDSVSLVYKGKRQFFLLLLLTCVRRVLCFNFVNNPLKVSLVVSLFVIRVQASCKVKPYCLPMLAPLMENVRDKLLPFER